MMSTPADAELLQLAANGSREALGQIAQRYVGFVYHTALRQVRDPHLAEDVTQAVFVILSSKIRQMNRDTLLHGWFFTTARYAARNALKTRARRMRCERQAAAMRHETTISSGASDAITPLLDEALAGLGETDRGAVLLSYFAGQGWNQVGAALGMTAEAARKRVERAIVRMRRFFARRGVEVAGAALALSMTSQAQASAPTHLAKVISASLLSAPPAGTAAATIAQGVIHMMTWAKLKLAATFTLVVLAVGGAGAMVLSHVEQNRDATVSDDGRSVTLDNGMTVELVGVSGFPDAEKSWHGDGAPRGKPLMETDGGGSSRVPEAANQVVVRITRIDPDLSGTLGMHCELIQKGLSTVRTMTDGDSVTTIMAFQRQEGQKTAEVRVKLATGDWETTAARQGALGMTMTDGVAFGEVHDLDGRCAMTVTDAVLDRQAKIIVIDTNGQEHSPMKLSVGHGGGFRQTSVQFPVPAAEIERIEFRTRPYNEWVQFKNISLTFGKNEGFKIEQGKTEDK